MPDPSSARTTVQGDWQTEPRFQDGRARLIVIEGLTPGLCIELDKDVTTIGRKPGNDVVFDTTEISRHHAEITRDGDAFAVTDLGSRNGVVLNGTALPARTPHRLSHGDTVRLANHLLLFYHYQTLSSSTGMSTIAVDSGQVREEVEALLRQLPGIRTRA